MLKLEKRKYKQSGVEKEALIIEFESETAKRTIEVRDSRSEEDLSPFVNGAVVYKHAIVVKCEGREAKFTFWGSVAEFEEDRKVYGAGELLNVFEVILSDAITAIEYSDIDEFAEAMNIKKPSEAIRSWRGINNTYRKLRRLLRLSYYELFDLHNAIIDYINEHDNLEIPAIA